MKILLVLIIGLVLSIGLCAKESPEYLLENLPESIMFFEAGKIRHYNKPELGASREYSKVLRSSVTWASVYVYDQGFKNITQKIVDESYEMAYQDITTFYSKAKRIDENRGSLNVRLNKSRNIKINYAWFEIVKGDGRKINTYLFVAGDDHYIYKIRISSEKLHKSKVPDETLSSKKISADPEKIYFVKYVLESFDSIENETSKIVYKTKTSTTYAPNTKGDVFKGGHWAGASGESDWLERDFSSPQLITGVYIGEASTDITTKGFRLVLKLKKESGEWVTIDELHDTNINRTALSGGTIGKSIPTYNKKLSPAMKATAFRLEFYGNGWFDATDIRIYTKD